MNHCNSGPSRISDRLRQLHLDKETLQIRRDGVDHQFAMVAVPKDFHPFFEPVPYFCGYDADSETLFISEEVPERFRAIMLTHTAMCNVILPDHSCCADLSAYEFTGVDSADQLEYAQMRLAYLTAMLEPVVDTPETKYVSNEAQVPGLEESLNFWRAFVDSPKAEMAEAYE